MQGPALASMALLKDVTRCFISSCLRISLLLWSFFVFWVALSFSLFFISALSYCVGRIIFSLLVFSLVCLLSLMPGLFHLNNKLNIIVCNHTITVYKIWVFSICSNFPSAHIAYTPFLCAFIFLLSLPTILQLCITSQQTLFCFLVTEAYSIL